jgi:hypothetical protein
MKVDIWYDELYPALIVAKAEETKIGTFCEIPEDLYEAYFFARKTMTAISYTIAEMTGVKP